MDETEFAALAERSLERIEAALEESAVEVDVERKEGGVLEIEYADGSRMVINRHRAAREIWVAAREGGYHFRWDGSSWRDTRSGNELFSMLSRLVSSQSGEAVELRP
jgi:CyaY protein